MCSSKYVGMKLLISYVWGWNEGCRHLLRDELG